MALFCHQRNKQQHQKKNLFFSSVFSIQEWISETVFFFLSFTTLSGILSFVKRILNKKKDIFKVLFFILFLQKKQRFFDFFGDNN